MNGKRRITSGGAEGGFPERLRQIMEGKSIRAFARLCGLSEGVVRQYLAGNSEPTRPALIAAARTAGVLVEWLATGNGPPRLEAQPASSPTGYAHLPMLSFDATADAVGASARLRRGVAFEEAWVRGFLQTDPSSLVVWLVQGDAMAPTLLEGDLVLIDQEQRRPRLEGIYVLETGGMVLLRRLQAQAGGTLQVLSDNPHYPSLKMSREELETEYRIVGRVVWSGKRL